ncbi:TonB-dependent receptor [Marinilabiliaceae bacterium JC017]|nr:TonB-dependent receptor [Marinilabiliaceae bacterium JC017]
MYKQITLSLTVLFFLSCCYTQAQSSVRIFGTITDARSGEALPATTIWNQPQQTGTVTNGYGYYIINATPGASLLQVSFIGYQTKTIALELQTDTLLNIQLTPGLQLRELTVTAPSSEGVASRLQPGRLQLPINEIVWAPAIGGESNLMASLKNLPGVSAGKEGASELFVRGGSHDQNLILLDGSPVYNLNHAFGLLSVFNTSTIKHVNLYKGAIPAQYGGRLSSVLDVAVREGNKQRYHGDFTLSTVAAGLTAEGPIVKDKASFLLSVRRSWPDLLVTGIASQVDNGEYIPGLYFMDINGKVNFTINQKHHFYLSYYTGQDKVFLKSHDKLQKAHMQQGWGNHLASARWNTILPSGGFSDVTLHYSTFYEFENFKSTYQDNSQSQNRRSDLEEWSVKANIEWPLNDRYKLLTGGEGYWRRIRVPHVTSRDNDETAGGETPAEYQRGAALYATGHYTNGPLAMQLGLRANIYGYHLSDYVSVEPRLSINYHLNDNLSLKTGAMYNTQALYAMSKSSNGFPGYTWIPLTGHLKPQQAWQVSAGFHWRPAPHLSLDVEGYYKWMRHLAGNYLYSSVLFTADHWYEMIDQGRGQAYGCEFLAEYIHPKWDVRLAYTLGKVESSFPSVNDGAWFPFDYDIRHDMTLTGAWHLYANEKNKGWITGNFALHSGTPVTLPSQSIKSMMPLFAGEDYWFDFSSLDHYTQPNNQRMKTYHRLDLGFHMEKKKTKGSRTWSFGIINAYNRQNSYIHFRDDKGKFKQLVMFPIMPFVSFKRSF